MLARVAISLVSFLFVLPLAAQEGTMATAVIPVGGTVRGFGDVEWRTDIALRNDTGGDVEVILTMPTAPGEPFLFTSIAAGATVTLPDVSRQTFGLQGVLSPIVVHTLGRRSVAVGAIVYGVVDGQPTRPQILSVYYGDRFPIVQTLPSLSLSETFRTNVGLVNLGEEPVNVLIALQRVAGRNLDVARLVLPARSLMQLPVESYFPLLSQGENFALVVETSGSSVYAYGSVISNASRNASFVSGP